LRCRKAWIAVLAAGATACREPADRPAGPVRFAVDSSGPDGGVAQLSVVGLDRETLRALRDARLPAERWESLLRVTVAGPDSTPIKGRYMATDSSVDFRPAFPFDAGRSYAARFDPARLPTPRSDSAISIVVVVAGAAAHAGAVVQRMLPTADTLPENLLRVYLEFSAPMSREPGTSFVHLVDDRGREVTHAFLPLDADFWNPAHTRYTVFLDPGRVKRGILPNEQLGRALRAGRAYAIVVDSAWRDALGAPLARGFRHDFRVGPAVMSPISIATWIVTPPRAGARDSLVVRFPTPLDHGLLRRAVGVETVRGTAVPGEIHLGAGEREWRFRPRDAWRAGSYRLVVLAILEDVAGNGIGHAFEVDMFERADSTTAPERYTIPFTVK